MIFHWLCFTFFGIWQFILLNLHFSTNLAFFFEFRTFSKFCTLPLIFKFSNDFRLFFAFLTIFHSLSIQSPSQFVHQKHVAGYLPPLLLGLCGLIGALVLFFIDDRTAIMMAADRAPVHDKKLMESQQQQLGK